MAIVYGGVVFVGAVVLLFHVLGRRYDHVDDERLAHAYFGLVMFFSGMALGEGRDVPEWVLGTGVLFTFVGIWYGALWQAGEELDERDGTG